MRRLKRDQERYQSDLRGFGLLVWEDEAVPFSISLYEPLPVLEELLQQS